MKQMILLKLCHYVWAEKDMQWHIGEGGENFK